MGDIFKSNIIFDLVETLISVHHKFSVRFRFQISVCFVFLGYSVLGTDNYLIGFQSGRFFLQRNI